MIMLHIDINTLHFACMVITHVDIIQLTCRRQKYATIIRGLKQILQRKCLCCSMFSSSCWFIQCPILIPLLILKHVIAKTCIVLKYHTLSSVIISKISLKKPGLFAFYMKRSRLRNKSVETRRATFFYKCQKPNHSKS